MVATVPAWLLEPLRACAPLLLVLVTCAQLQLLRMWCRLLDHKEQTGSRDAGARDALQDPVVRDGARADTKKWPGAGASWSARLAT